MYTTERTGLEKLIWQNVTGQLRAFVEDMFHEYNVDLYLCTSVHTCTAVSLRAPEMISLARRSNLHITADTTGLKRSHRTEPAFTLGYCMWCPY